MKLTRRELAAAVIAGTAAAQAPQPPASPDDLQAARDRLKTNGEALARQRVAMGTEPAFQFKA
jgi:hypothetical protein